MAVKIVNKALKSQEEPPEQKEVVIDPNSGIQPHLKIGTINPLTGKRVVPKSPGRPKGTKGIPRKKKIKPVVFGSPDAKKVEKLISDTATMPQDALLQLAAQAKEEQEATNKKDIPPDVRNERMALAYRLSIRGLTLQQISDAMGISVYQAKNLVDGLAKKLRLDPKTLDVGHQMGETLAFYTEIRQMALLAASNGNSAVGVKLQAMGIALQAEAQKNLFLTKIGVYSPVIVERIERWVMNTTDQMTTPPTQNARVNLAAEIGRSLAKRSVMGVPPGEVEDVTDYAVR